MTALLSTTSVAAIIAHAHYYALREQPDFVRVLTLQEKMSIDYDGDFEDDWFGVFDTEGMLMAVCDDLLKLNTLIIKAGHRTYSGHLS